MKKPFIIAVCMLLLAACGEDKKNTAAQTTETISAAPVEIPAGIEALLSKHTCLTCHKAEEKLVGPSYKEIAQKGYAAEEIVNLVHNPRPENWPGYPPMPAQKDIPREDALTIANWINTLK